MSDDKNKPLSTAEFLGRFHSELIQSGLDPDIANDLTLAAGKFEVNNGITVKGGE